jgi:hypothetical protein
MQRFSTPHAHPSQLHMLSSWQQQQQQLQYASSLSLVTVILHKAC